MNTKSKALLLSMCAVLLVAATAFGTLAYLTDTEAVTNTFTVGSVGLQLDEAKVNVDGTYVTDHENRTEDSDNEGNQYHLLPGHTYYKDPTVTVDAGSEDAYVRMIVTVENIDQLKAALPYSEIVHNDDGTTHQVVNNQYYADDCTTFLLQMLCGGWDSAIWKYEGYTESADGKTGNYEFRYHKVVAKSADATVLEDLFKTITVPGEIDNDHLAYLKDVKIVVTAHAIQADGFDNADAAWAAFSK